MCERRVNLLVYSLSLHRHSYIGFILAFASSIHNKQSIGEYRNVHSIRSHTLPKPTLLTFMRTQVLLVSCASDQWPGLVSPAWQFDPILELLFFLPTQPSVCEEFRSLRFSVSLSLHRHPFICILFSSRFTSHNKFKSPETWNVHVVS